jgi:hypothetical protein
MFNPFYNYIKKFFVSDFLCGVMTCICNEESLLSLLLSKDGERLGIQDWIQIVSVSSLLLPTVISLKKSVVIRNQQLKTVRYPLFLETFISFLQQSIESSVGKGV